MAKRATKVKVSEVEAANVEPQAQEAPDPRAKIGNAIGKLSARIDALQAGLDPAIGNAPTRAERRSEMMSLRAKRKVLVAEFNAADAS